MELRHVFGAIDANSYDSIEHAIQLLATYGEEEPLGPLGVRQVLLMQAASMVIDRESIFRCGRFFCHTRGFLKQQALKMPYAAHSYRYVKAEGGTRSTIAAEHLKRDGEGFFAQGTAVVTRCDSMSDEDRYQARRIVEHDSSTGTLILEEEFPFVVTEGAEFYLLFPPDTPFLRAVAEQARHIHLLNVDEEELLDYLDPDTDDVYFQRSQVARHLLRPYIAAPNG